MVGRICGLLVVALLAGCGGGSGRPENTLTPVTTASPADPATTAPFNPGATAAPVTPTVTLAQDNAATARPCSAGDLAAASGRPVSATAMMSLSVTIANVGETPCLLVPPVRVRLFWAGQPEPLASGQPRRIEPLVIVPTRAPVADEPYAPVGAAFLWLVWTWRIDGPCRELQPAEVTIVAEFVGGLTMEVPARARLGPCRDTLSVAGFGLVPSP